MKDVLFETKKFKVSRILDNLEKLNIAEISDLICEFDSICSMNSIDEKINLLDEMETSLKDYNEFFMFNSKIKFLYNTIDSVTVVDKFSEYEEIAVSILNSYNNFKDKDLDFDFEEMCSSIYKVIKKEIILKNSSNLLDMVKDDELLCYGIDKYVQLDIKEIMNSLNYNPFIKSIKDKMNEINMNGLDAHYINYDLIRLIAVFDNYSDKEEEYKIMIENTKMNLENNVNRLNDFYGVIFNRLEKNDKMLRALNEKWVNYKDEVFGKCISIFLSTLLFGGIACEIPRSTKNLSNVDVYKTYTESYIEGREVEVKEDYKTKKSREVTRTLEVAEDIGHDRVGTTYRYLRIYDLTDIVLDSIEEYAKLDLDEYELRYKDNRNQLLDVTLMDEGDKRVTIVTQDYSDSKEAYSASKHALIAGILYVLEAISLLVPFSPIQRTIDLIKYKKKYKNDLLDYNDTLEQVIKDLELYNDIIKRNYEVSRDYMISREEIINVFKNNNPDVNDIEAMIIKNHEYNEKLKVLNKRWSR